jgi:uncharacterized protein
MSANKDTVLRYLDGFNRSDHQQILSCLTDDIRWTVFGAYRLEGKDAYDAEIENPAFEGSPVIEVNGMVEEGDVIMAELSIEAKRATGETMRLVAGEVFAFRDGKIAERRAYLVELKENDFK